jgi:hypothetical protein
MEENKYPIKKEWEEYYNTLEAIRKSGITNMFGAAPYLARIENIDERLARDVLLNWMQNYNELSKIYNWTR